ncbi:MAG: 50S ribosomal protein L9 [Desulfobacterota bacterium]|nr:50S ribosomal protein L9 [Thermodesulfobacteriota bacterium]MDW8001628.1 50S ribosomal protein L9 [Deltaproteobacteria bacterium]
MRVILTENVEGVGKKGEVITVRDGYGRNYLIPKGLAVPATEGNLKRLDHLLREMEKKRQRIERHSQELKRLLEEKVVNIYKKIGKDGKLFGSVTQKDISDAIQKTFKISIDKRNITIEEPIRSEGIHTVEVDLGQGIKASLKISVERKE